MTIPIPGFSKPRKTSLASTCSGGVELIFQGRASGNSKVDAQTISDAINIIQQRVNQLGVEQRDVVSAGSNQIDVSSPDVKNISQAEKEVGTTAQLFFYDWEESVIGPNGKVDPLDTTVTGDGNGGGSPGFGTGSTSEYAAVLRAAQQPLIPESKMKYKLEAAPYGTYYYVDDATKTVLTPKGETAPTEAQAVGYLKSDIAESGEKLPPGARVVWVEPGTIVRQAVTPNDEPDAKWNYWYVLRDDPAISGKDVSNPVEQVDTTTSQPVVSFGFKGNAVNTFTKVTAALATRGENESFGGQENYQHFAVTLDNRLVTVPYINFNENPYGIDASNGSEISGDFTIASAQQLANLLASGALPITLAVISSQQVSATLGHQALNQGLIAGPPACSWSRCSCWCSTACSA